MGMTAPDFHPRSHDGVGYSLLSRVSGPGSSIMVSGRPLSAAHPVRGITVMRTLVVRSLLLGILLFLDTGRAARADLVFLKDGFVLQGKVQREGKIEFEG